MDQEPDQSQAWMQGEFVARLQAEELRDEIIAASPKAHVTIEPHREGSWQGWRVYLWEA